MRLALFQVSPFQNDAAALQAGHLALTHGADRLWFHGPQGLSATLFQRPTAYDQSPLAGVALSWNPTTLPALSLSAGYLHEQGKLLGSQGSGAFGELSGHTLFLRTGLATTTEQRWELSAQGEVGMVTPAVAQSQFIKDISTLTSSAFRLQAHKRLAKGASFRLALSQPLLVESGATSLSLPTGRTKDGLVVGTALSAPLTPSGRQLGHTAQVDLPLLGGEIALAATRSPSPSPSPGISRAPRANGPSSAATAPPGNAQPTQLLQRGGPFLEEGFGSRVGPWSFP